jgi:hypothetical protein
MAIMLNPSKTSTSSINNINININTNSNTTNLNTTNLNNPSPLPNTIITAYQTNRRPTRCGAWVMVSPHHHSTTAHQA